MLPEEKDVVCGRHRPHDARVPQTPCHAPLTRVTVSHASVAAGARRVLASYRRRVTSPPPLRSSEPTPSAKRVPVQERPAGGRGSDPTRANGGAFGKLSKWRCERVKPPSAARKNNDGPRGTGTDAAPSSCKRYGADTMARLP